MFEINLYNIVSLRAAWASGIPTIPWGKSELMVRKETESVGREDRTAEVSGCEPPQSPGELCRRGLLLQQY